MSEKKVTKKEKLEMLKGVVEASNVDNKNELLEFLVNEQERLNKRSSGATKTQKANEALFVDVLAALERVGKPVVVSQLLEDAELKEAVEATGANFSSQKVSALLNKMIDAKLVVNTKEKKKSFYSVAETEVED